MNIKIELMLAAMVLMASVATMTMVSNLAFAEKTPHPSNHGACVSENAKTKTPGEPNNLVAHAICAHIRP
jgi:hypothetical protein